MANTDNKINISDAWKSLSTIQVNVADSWKNIDDGYVNIGDAWKQIWASGDRGVFGGGNNAGSTWYNTLDYITISTTGNATDFGDLTVACNAISATSNGSSGRGVWGGGVDGSTYKNNIDYITISTPGNASSFGILSAVRGYLAAASNGTNNRGVFGGGYNAGGSNFNILEYITISTPGNTTDFGDLTVARRGISATSNAINNRGVWGGGYTSSNSNVIDYVTISTAGNATDFGDLSSGATRGYLSATSNGTNNRGVFGGGNISAVTNTIDYITISTAGNATDFGDLTVARSWTASTSNSINDRGVWGGGLTSTHSNVMDYITISSTGNATDFGDLTVSRLGGAGASNS